MGIGRIKVGHSESKGKGKNDKRRLSSSNSNPSTIGEGTPNSTKECSVLLPVLSSPIFSTVQLLTTTIARKTMEGEEAATSKLADDNDATPKRPQTAEGGQKRPIYLGDLIIGYETVTPKKKPKAESKTGGRRRRLKTLEEDEADEESDLTPIVMQQNSVFVYDDHGKKRLVNLRKVAEMEENGKKAKKKKGKCSRVEQEPVTMDPMETLKGSSVSNQLEMRMTSEDGKVVMETVEGRWEEEERLRDKENGYEKGGGGHPAEVIANIPISKDNPFLVAVRDDVNGDLGGKKCESDSPIDRRSVDGEDEFLKSLGLTTVPGKLSPSEIPVLSEDGEPFIIEAKDATGTKDICNICGTEVPSRKDATTFLERDESNGTCYVCLTCTQKVSLSELTRHKATCFLTQDEFYSGCYPEDTLPKQEVKFRMVACLNCVKLMQQL